MRHLFVLAFLIPTLSFAHAQREPLVLEPISIPELQAEPIVMDLPRVQMEKPNLKVASEALFAVNLDTQDIVFAKNEHEVRSIASITKMMTSLVVLGQGVDLGEVITISSEDITLAKRAHRASNLRAGMHFTRERLLNLALMSSENVAAAALGRTTFTSGLPTFIEEMNRTATELGMLQTTFEDPIGIGTGNQSTASDLVRLIAAAQNEQLIRDFSTTKFKPIEIPVRRSNGRTVEYKNTNALVGFQDWNILVQKTGFTNAAGHCVVMIVDILGEKYAVVVLDSPTNQQRAFDAIKVREWLQQSRELDTIEASNLSPYHKFVFFKHGKPIVAKLHHKRHHKHIA